SDTTFKRVYDRLQDLMRERQRNATLVAKARWAIIDRDKFRNLIEDVKEFNDSLIALLPDLSSRTLDADTRFNKNILRPENLQSSTNSFILLPARAGDLLLDLAAQVDNLGFKSTGIAQLNGEEDFNRELNEELAKRNPGGILGSMYYRNGSSLGEDSDGYRLKNLDRERMFVSSPSLLHPALGIAHLILAMSLTQTASRYTRRLNVEHCPNFDNFDIEASPYCEGEIPGTLTVIGYSKARNKYLKSLLPELRTVIQNHRPPTKFPVKYRLDRIMDLKHGSSPKTAENSYYCDLKDSPGFESTVLNYRSKEPLKFQISSMCSWLNGPS